MASITPVLNGDSGLSARTKINNNDNALNVDIGTNANNITALQNSIMTVDLETGKTASFTKALGALTKLEAIDFKHVLSSPIVTIGTTPAGSELLPATAVPSGEVLNVNLATTFVGSQTIYVTLTGGNVDVEYYYRTNRFTP